MEDLKIQVRDERLKMLEETLKRESVLRAREKRVSERKEAWEKVIQSENQLPQR